jgi:cytochrome c553
MNKLRWIVCALAAMAAAPAALAQSAPEVRAGQTVAGTCANCHGTQGNARGAMPSIAGRERSYLVEQMKAFRDGKRAGTIMPQLAKGYTDEQVELVAAHFSRQKPDTR